MSELTLFLIHFSYLAVLWIFVLSAVSVIRTDMFGARAPQPRADRKRKTAKAAKAPRPTKRRGAPSYVIVVEGANQGARAELNGAPVLIGRGSDAAIRLDDDYVSTRHARIAVDDSTGEWYLEDLGSTNGSYVGSSRITQPLPVTAGTQVRIGKTVLELRK